MAGGEVRFGTVSMNICESNHRRSRGARALHGHKKNIFRKNPPDSAGVEVTQNENFGLELQAKHVARSTPKALIFSEVCSALLGQATQRRQRSLELRSGSRIRQGRHPLNR